LSVPSQLARATIANIAAWVKMIFALMSFCGCRGLSVRPRDDCALSLLSCVRQWRSAFGVEEELLGRMEKPPFGNA
jgi:hypothetical protein